MKRYISLLRGINVGGGNKIAMSELRSAFEEAGFSEVSTYINSGNVFFSSRDTDQDGLKSRCEKIILSRFGLDIAVMVISPGDLAEALGNAPEWWGADPGSKHNAIFVLPPATAAGIAGQVGPIKPEYERAECFGRVIFWSAAAKTLSRTAWFKIIGTPAYQSLTIRNANTARKLLELAGGVK